uniref:Uncharacterized protein n=1 Tax=Eutreptiella gymnastica TaxID=73025 RepID=A0A7S4LG81_9EUGL
MHATAAWRVAHRLMGSTDPNFIAFGKSTSQRVPDKLPRSGLCLLQLKGDMSAVHLWSQSPSQSPNEAPLSPVISAFTDPCFVSKPLSFCCTSSPEGHPTPQFQEPVPLFPWMSADFRAV